MNTHEDSAPILVSKRRYSFKNVVMAIGSILAAFGSFYFFQLHFSGGQLDSAPPLVVGLFFLGMSTAGAYLLLKNTKILVFQKRIEIHSAFGFIKNIIHREDILGWMDRKIDGKYYQGKELYLETSKGKIRIYSILFSNFEEMKKAIIKGIKKDYSLFRHYEKIENLQAGILTIIVGVFFAMASSSFYSKDPIDFLGYGLLGLLSIACILAGIYLIKIGFSKTE